MSVDGVRLQGHLDGSISIHDDDAGTVARLTPREQAAYEAWLAEGRST